MSTIIMQEKSEFRKRNARTPNILNDILILTNNKLSTMVSNMGILLYLLAEKGEHILYTKYMFYDFNCKLSIPNT